MELNMTDNDKKTGPKELTEETVIYLAGLTPLQKLQEIRKTAKLYKVPVSELKKLVKEKTPAPSPDAAEMVDAALAERRKQADVLIAIGKKAKLFHTPAPDREAFAHLQIGDHFETLRVRGEFRKWLRHSYFQQTKGGCNAEAMQVAVETLAAIAEFEGDEIEVFTRVGERRGVIYIDLGDDTWRAIEVTAKGWKVIDRPLVHFQRSSSTRPLPLPERGGSIDDLRPFVHVKGDAEFVLLASYLAASLRPRANYPVLIIVGQHGSAKTWTAGLIVRFVDPRLPDRRSMPREEDNLIVAAKAAHLLSFDNVSTLPLEMSDALSRLSTGGGAGKRRLYTDDDEVLFSGKRPVVLNGITDFATQPDLLDRVVMLSLEPIADADRRDEKALQTALEVAAPKIFGALLDGLAAGLRTIDQVSIPNLPRMADYALWGEACGSAWWKRGAFIDAYRQNRAEAVELSIEANPVASAVQAFMENRIRWVGTATSLLGVLTAIVSETTARSRGWPLLPHVLSGQLRRAAPNLRKIGIGVEWSDGHHYGRQITIEKSEGGDPQQSSKRASPASPASRMAEINGEGGDARDARDAVLHTQGGGSRARFSTNPLKSQNGGMGGAEVTAKGEGGISGPVDAQGKPTDDPEQSYYARKEREQLEEAYQAELAKQKRAQEQSVDGREEKNARDDEMQVAKERHASRDAADPGPIPDFLMRKAPPAADVVDEAKKAKQEADQPVSAPDPGLMMQDSKEDAPPQSSPAEPPARTNGNEMPDGLSEQQRQDAERYFARWGDHARASGWTAAQQDRLIRQIAGREVKQLTDTQALVGNKVFYRFQLNHT
jgi:hypothetical protein